MTTDLLREARSALSACCADSEMSLDEWRENQDLIARIDAALAQPAASEPKVGVSAPYYPAMPQAFADYMAQQMPPGTVISEPLWWAPRIWRTAMRLYAAPPAANNYHDAARAARHEGISAMSDTRKQPTDAEMLTMARECRVEYGFNVPETLLFARRLWKAGRKAGLEEAAWVCDTVDGSDYDNCSRLLKALSDVIRTRAILRGLAEKPE